jgi:ATP phosphoribosyltransferase
MGLNIVVPDGSMKKKVMELFSKAGLPISFGVSRKNVGSVEAQWINQVVFERPPEIPDLMAEGYFDTSIVGEDWIADWGFSFPTLLSMAIGREKNRAVKIVLAVSKESPVQAPGDLPMGSKVASEYVRLARKFFSNLGRNDIIVKPSCGNTEAKIRYGMAGVIDVTETGNSIDANGLKIIHTLMESNTLVIANPVALREKKKRPKIEWFARLIEGAYVAITYMGIVANVPKNLLDRAAEIIGGLKGPTCAPLHGVKGWYALSSFISKEEWDDVSYRLLEIGVDDIIPTWDIPCVMRSKLTPCKRKIDSWHIHPFC